MMNDDLKKQLVSRSCFGLFESDEPCDLVKCSAKEVCKSVTSKRKEKLINMIREERKMSASRPSKHDYYLDIALAVSKRSTCLKRHYGCVIVKDDIIIATGYNGNPRGELNCCEAGVCKRPDAERYAGYENCDSVHAEQNALIAASRDRLLGATVYIACEEYRVDENMSAKYEEEIWGFVEDDNPVPCNICKRMLKNAGVKEVINRRSLSNVCD